MKAIHAIRAVTRFYPSRKGQGHLLSALHKIFQPPSPTWLVAPACGRWPALELDISSPWQEKLFFFPDVYSRFYQDSKLASYLPRALKPGAIFLDIGANIGIFSIMASSLVGPEGTVLAFEPEPTSFGGLERSVKLNALANVRCCNLALSDRDGVLSFHSANDGRASSLVAEVPVRRDRYFATISVEVTSLDAYLANTDLDLKRIGLIKVDVEGEEERTVGGMIKTLERAGFPPLWCEVRGPFGSTRAPNTFAAVNARLADLGYAAYRWVDGLQPVTVEQVQRREDILFHQRSDERSERSASVKAVGED